MITPTEGQGPNMSEHVPDGGLRNGKPLITKRHRSLITEIPTRHEPIGGGKGSSHKGSVPGPVQPILRVARHPSGTRRGRG